MDEAEENYYAFLNLSKSASFLIQLSMTNVVISKNYNEFRKKILC